MAMAFGVLLVLGMLNVRKPPDRHTLYLSLNPILPPAETKSKGSMLTIAFG
jgi:hypothetical protein